MSWVTNSSVTPRRCHTDADQVLEVGPGLRVDRRERLVHEQHPRLVRDRAGDRHPLLHAAGELPRVGAAARRPARPRPAPRPPARAAARGGRPLAFSGSSTFSRTRSQGNRLRPYSWNTTASAVGRPGDRLAVDRDLARRSAAAGRRCSAAAWSCRSRTGRRRRRTRPAATVKVRSRDRLDLAAVPVVDLAKSADLEQRHSLPRPRSAARTPWYQPRTRRSTSRKSRDSSDADAGRAAARRSTSPGSGSRAGTARS